MMYQIRCDPGLNEEIKETEASRGPCPMERKNT
jgi:hypothetical protein